MDNISNKKVFLIHGFEGTPNGGWRPYLMRELEKQDVYACSLSMPSPEAPKLDEWLEEIKRHIDRNQNDYVYLVGHSLGGTAILRYLEKYTSPNLKGVIIASAPCHQNANEKIRDFLSSDFEWIKMKNKVSKVIVIHGDNDPLVPISDAQEISQELGGELILIPDGKHLNGSAGFIELPEVLSALIEIIK
jgi:predicted alpha/beta hydrolase family esterase